MGVDGKETFHSVILGFFFSTVLLPKFPPFQLHFYLFYNLVVSWINIKFKRSHLE